MKILCIANEIDPKLYTKEIKQEFGHIDIILSSGNLPVEYLNFISASLEKPLYYVLAKHELNSIETPNSYLKLLDKPIVIEGILVAGFSGAEKQNGKIRPFSNLKKRQKLNRLSRSLFFKKILGQSLKILVTCSKPKDETTELNRFIKKHRPEILLYGQGHLYNEAERITTLKSTRLINTSGHYVLEV